MSKTKKIALLAVIAMVLTMLPVQLFAADTEGVATRLSGATRVETALAVCDAGWKSATTVIVAAADQDNLVDALAAAPLAGQENAPILLTFKDTLDPAVKAKISALGAKKVYAVGAVSDSVKSAIAAITGVTVEALKGSNRWDTAKAVNAKLTSPAGCFIVGYAALADALSVSAYAAKNKYAIILADVDGNIPVAQAALGTKTYIVGGTTLVKDIAGATRLAGADRFETNKVVLNTLTFDYNKVYIANGFNEHLVDSLVAAPLAALTNAPIVLASASAIAGADIVNAKLTSLSTVIALGGTGVVSDAVRDSVKYNTPATFAVTDIIPVGLTAFKVVFNQEVDKDTAQNIANYKLEGGALPATSVATKLADNKSVLVIVDDGAGAVAPFTEHAKKTIEVRGSLIYNSAKDSAAASLTKTLEFVDTDVPTIDSVTATGNYKVTVKFSEPVFLPAAANVQAWKLDGVPVTSKGYSSCANPASSSTTSATPIGTAVDIYFGTVISAGTHTLEVQAGTSLGQLSDGANFIFAKSSKDFTVETQTTAPSVQSVTCTNNTIAITFDRAMYQDPLVPTTGAGSALNISYYNINDKGTGATAALSASVGTAPAFKSGTGSKVIEVGADTGIISAGVNVVTLNKDMKDAWGNKLSTGTDNIRVSFTYAADSTKPTVSSVSVLTSSKIRIQFSEKIDYTFGETAANYTLKKSNGVVIPLVSAATVPASTNSDTVELTVAANTLNSTGYSLKIQNLQDLAVSPNVMDTYTTTFDGIDDVGPTVAGTYRTSATKASVVFNDKMDTSTLIADNFGYVDNTANPGVYRSLPAGATLSIDGTQKIVTITFPSAYTNTVAVAFTGAGSTYDVYQIRVSNVKDVTGNLLQGIASTAFLTAPAAGPTLTAGTFNLYDDGSGYIRAEFSMSQEITNLAIADFNVAGVAPDSGYTSGTKVVLRYTTTASCDAIRLAGIGATLTTVAVTSTAVTGAALTAIVGETVNDEQLKPKVLAVQIKAGDAAQWAATESVLNIQFSESIDTSIAGLYNDDFIASMNGTGFTLGTPKFLATAVANDTLTYDLGAITAMPGGNTVFVKAVAANASIRDYKDAYLDYNVYAPSSTDTSGRTTADVLKPVVKSVAFSDGTTVAAGTIDTDDTITITYSEPVVSVTAALTRGATVTGTLESFITAAGGNTVGSFATAFVVGTAIDNATSTATLSADGKTLTIHTYGFVSSGGETKPALAFTSVGTVTDGTNTIDAAVTATSATTF